MRRTLMEAGHEAFRSAFRDFADKEIVPFHDDWERAGMVPRALWEKAGARGFLRMNVARAGASGVGFSMHTDIVAPYLLSYGAEEQKRRWLPPTAAGTVIAGLAMTQPGAGSDLAGITTSTMPASRPPASSASRAGASST
jgi:alkylation response protein AidB-like acyl-CoA dehydrogenase